MKLEPIDSSETLGFKTQAPGKYPKENILHLPSCLLISQAATFFSQIAPSLMANKLFYSVLS